MRKILENTDMDVIIKAKEILIQACMATDDMLKREKYTCYTIQKKGLGGKFYQQSKREFLNLGYEPEIQSESENYITYMIPDF